MMFIDQNRFRSSHRSIKTIQTLRITIFFFFFCSGWYWIINSCDLKAGEVKAISYCGRNVVLFRGQNGKAYVLDAYCAHMGAHLGVGGKVRFDTCIECPFHGWAFDGETGKGVLSGGENKIVRTADRFEYEDVERVTPVKTNENSNIFLKRTVEAQEVKLKRYICRELNGSIVVWYHSDENLRETPLYEPFDIQDELNNYGMQGKRKDEINIK